MKWDTLQGDVSAIAAKITVGEVATVEALRAIAEQLELVTGELVILNQRAALIEECVSPVGEALVSAIRRPDRPI